MNSQLKRMIFLAKLIFLLSSFTLKNNNRELLIFYPKISIEKTLKLAKESANNIEGVKYIGYCDKNKTIMLAIAADCKFSDSEIADKIMVEAYLGTKYTINQDVSISQLQSSCN
jgi:hypothetical protein